MTKEGYLKFLGQILREHYNIIKDTGTTLPEREHFHRWILDGSQNIKCRLSKGTDRLYRKDTL